MASGPERGLDWFPHAAEWRLCWNYGSNNPQSQNMPGKNPPTQPLTVGHIPQGWPSPSGKPQPLQTITPGLLDVPPGSAHFPLWRGLTPF